MASRPSQASLSERSVASRNEADGSCPAEDPACTDSSFSSLSLTSSPELGSARECKEDGGPLDASTPARKTSQKIQRSSEEKEKLKLQRKKEKEEKEKAEKLRAKEEKRKERQEALEAKLEEKRKKEEEKRLKEEEKRIKAEKAEITRFFQKPKTPPAPKTLAGWCGKFAPFEIKENMVLAPSCRVTVEPEALDQLDSLLQAQSCASNFLEELKSRGPCRSGPTLAPSRRDDDANSSQAGDVPERDSFGRMKLLQFCENHRPAYWGTWNKKTSAIRPRNPWSKDEKLLDYELESDEEWEEEEPGESLSHSEGDDDEDGGEEEDDDDGFFVPHGYLSEDEGVTEECDPENQKVRQKLKDKEWDELMAKGKRFRVLQPVKVGCVWEGAEEAGGADWKLLQPFAVALLESSAADEEQAEKSVQKKTKNQQILGQLLPLLHGNVNGSRVIIQEFQECCRLGLLPLGQEGNPSRGEGGGGGGGGDGPGAASSSSQIQTPLPSEENAVPSKARLKRLISENSVYTKRPDHRMCWYVHPEVLKSYGQESLPVPCQWNYVTQVPSVAAREEGGSAGHSPGGGGGGAAAPTTPAAAVPAGKRKLTGSMSITKFMKRTPEAGQTPETDGFQADTEEEDDDCILMEVESSPESWNFTEKPAVPIPTPAGGGGVGRRVGGGALAFARLGKGGVNLFRSEGWTVGRRKINATWRQASYRPGEAALGEMV
ncbi:hypothetical protein JRQ81_008875 [Phrynocephalus forsythii]|uniref:Chromatin assembly factor 1 subunit A n=1 Tax=Phrynocephalus forsythii TaxID=171643 RepID=A0A9Q0XCR8_9SAUR|nr:hypothetical protein JRQ81_008875 [Phrynocephalus forsythii]